MSEITFVVTLVIAGVTFVSAVVGIGLWLGRVSVSAESAQKRAHDLANQMSAFQYEVATKYVQQSALARLEEKIMTGLENLGKRIDVLHSSKD